MAQNKGTNTWEGSKHLTFLTKSKNLELTSSTSLIYYNKEGGQGVRRCLMPHCFPTIVVLLSLSLMTFCLGIGVPRHRDIETAFTTVCAYTRTYKHPYICP